MDNLYQDSYQDPAFPTAKGKVEPVMSVTDWLITLLLMIIPLVNLIMLIVWAVSDSGNRNRTNWARASLIMAAISIGLYILIFASIFGLAAAHGGL